MFSLSKAITINYTKTWRKKKHTLSLCKNHLGNLMVIWAEILVYCSQFECHFSHAHLFDEWILFGNSFFLYIWLQTQGRIYVKCKANALFISDFCRLIPQQILQKSINLKIQSGDQVLCAWNNLCFDFFRQFMSLVWASNNQ